MISMYAYTKYIIEETPTAFGTAIGTGAIDGDGFFMRHDLQHTSPALSALPLCSPSLGVWTHGEMCTT